MRPAVRRRHVAGEDPHRGRLAGPVRTQEPENLSAFDSEADVVYGGDPAVALGNVFDLNHRSILQELAALAESADGQAGNLDSPGDPDIDCEHVRYRQQADYRPKPA